MTLVECADFYLKVDVVLLVDVLENFRDICLEIYNLNPSCYYTDLGLSFDCILKYTKIKLELLTNNDMFLIFEKGIHFFI